MIFQLEMIRHTWNEARDLMNRNQQETGALSAEEFDPDYERYCAIEDLGISRLYTMRDDMVLAGYCIVLVLPHLHYKSTLFGIQDVLFVDKPYRGISSVKFLQFMDRLLKDEGVKKIVRQVSGKNDYSRTLHRLNYDPLEVAYIRSF